MVLLTQSWSRRGVNRGHSSLDTSRCVVSGGSDTERALYELESKEYKFMVLETNRSTKWLVQKDRRKSSKHGESRQYVY